MGGGAGVALGPAPRGGMGPPNQQAYSFENRGFVLNFTLWLPLLGPPKSTALGRAYLPPPADKCTKLSRCKGDIRIKDNLRS